MKRFLYIFLSFLVAYIAFILVEELYWIIYYGRLNFSSEIFISKIKPALIGYGLAYMAGMIIRRSK
ncbi:hypothetical protein QV08_10580 [Gallibacterium salpingitidis]|uniref:Uncharacterized protein n=1 Tax=Gallibacterium salpingitidis TaxID=505341 RepID=A0AB36E1X5_9PAST|nr:hypothetical protein [Gallibacterium salpingitidis]OBX06348.1 hypothetical protein QV08_10580 [Gallibacterium salpingitidis]OBX09968.1 hypothetical protein QV09_07175 [Gallibacterium salpingitidis]